MDLKLDLFVHGVPKGQRIWGPIVDDRKFIENFYGRKVNVEVQLLIEIIQIGSNINSYYTYYRKGNILDKDNRAGSYFALTIKSNAYYTDIANMYNILDAAYQKFVLGTILKNEYSVTKFIVQDFDQVDKHLQNLETEIMHYLSSYSIDSDFVGLNDFTVNSKYEAANINLLECKGLSLIEYVKNKGNLSVSPLHPLSEIIELTKRKDQEIQNIKSLSQQEITEIKDIANKNIKEAGIENDKVVNSIKKEYESVDKKIESLQKQLENKQKDISDLESKIEKSKDINKKYISINNELNEYKKDLEQKNKALTDIKKSLSGISVLEEVNGLISSENQGARKERLLNRLNKYHPLVDLVVMLILLLALFFSMKKDSRSNVIPGIDESKQKIEQLQKELDETKDELVSAENELTEMASDKEENIKTTDKVDTDKNKHASIDIREFKNANDKMVKDIEYHISIKDAEGGEWVSDDFEINGNTIKAKRTGTFKIEYVVNSETVAFRNITVR